MPAQHRAHDRLVALPFELRHDTQALERCEVAGLGAAMQDASVSFEICDDVGRHGSHSSFGRWVDGAGPSPAPCGPESSSKYDRSWLTFRAGRVQGAAAFGGSGAPA